MTQPATETPKVVVYRANLVERDLSGTRAKAKLEAGGRTLSIGTNQKPVIDKLSKFEIGVEWGWGVVDRDVPPDGDRKGFTAHDLVSFHEPDKGGPLPQSQARGGGGGGWRPSGKSAEEIKSIAASVALGKANELAVHGVLMPREGEAVEDAVVRVGKKYFDAMRSWA